MQQLKKLIGAKIITPVRVLEDYELRIDGRKIAGIAPRDPATDAGATLIDAGGKTAMPGLIDIHVHGGGGFDFMDAEPQAFYGAAQMHARHGTTTLLPTSLASDDASLYAMMRAYHEAMRHPYRGAHMPGLHLEGPFFSLKQAGAQAPDAITPPTDARVNKMLEEGHGKILRWSSAPELPGAMAFSRRIVALGIVSSIGHTDAEESHVAEGIENGYTHITHLYSTMSTIVRRHSYRFPGVLECAYMYPELTSEIIADGCHVPGSLLRLAYMQLGPRRLCLVTDALRGAGMAEGESIIGSKKTGRPCIIEDGVAKLPDRSAFAGSVATADRLIRNMVLLAGAPLQDAVRMMTSTPAEIMHLSGKGMLAAGYDADIALMDDTLHVTDVWIGGEKLTCENEV